jgi:hypothetical protein
MLKENKPTTIFILSNHARYYAQLIYLQKLLSLADACTYQGEPAKITAHELDIEHVNKTQK